MMSMMYQAYQNHMDLTSPWRTGAAAGLKYLNLAPQGVSDRLFRPVSYTHLTLPTNREV